MKVLRQSIERDSAAAATLTLSPVKGEALTAAGA